MKLKTIFKALQWAGEKAQWHRLLFQDLHSILAATWELTASEKRQSPDLHGHICYTCAYKHTGKTLLYIKIGT